MNFNISNEPQSEEEHSLPLPTEKDQNQSKISRFKAWFLSRKKWTIPASVLILVMIVSAIPLTRYKIAAIALKNDFSLQVVDDATARPVSDALVVAGNVQAITNGSGEATLKNLPVGQKTLTITKKHYRGTNYSYLVPIMDQKTKPRVSLTATGRQVSVKVHNFVNQKPLSGVSIKADDAEATTDEDGNALLVLPAQAKEQEAQLSLKGFNQSTVTLSVTEEDNNERNVFKLVPAGKVYFMSKRTGKLDLMKSNLDGSEATVVLAGTGHEQEYKTSLSPSPDWKYVALVTRRSPNDATPQLYMINTEDDKLTNVDNGNSEFYLYGWSSGNLIYEVTRNDVPIWQQGKNKLKSYDAANSRLTMLDQSAGSDETLNAGESYIGVGITGDTVVFAKSWYGHYYASDLSGKQHSLHTISASGANHKTVSTYDAVKYSIHLRQPGPSQYYLSQTSENEPRVYYEFSPGGQPKTINIDEDKFYDSMPTYIFSAAGKKVAWSEPRDGKEAIIVSDSRGQNSTVVANLEDHSIFSWFGDSYLVLSKKSNELYVMDAAGGDPVRITSYQSVSSAHGYY